MKIDEYVRLCDDMCNGLNIGIRYFANLQIGVKPKMEKVSIIFVA